ncbi:hypothetical protein IKG49_02800 [Candidatus Saccharibacteria bacterium]|nr:hypothetical protein [Candidatus Saccharibacteria bacterium]
MYKLSSNCKKWDKSWKVFGLVVFFTTFFGLGNCYADDNTTSVDQINITIQESCSVEGVIASGGEHTATAMNNNYYSEIGTTTFNTYCNDNGGYAIYAIGYSNDEYGNTLMKHDSDATLDFDTGTQTSGPISNWAMKLTKVSGLYEPTIHEDSDGPYTAYHVVPDTMTKVASFVSNTEVPATGQSAIGSSFTTTYAAWISATQSAGTYTGKVRYTLVHPYTAPAPVVCNPSGTTIGTNTNTDIKCMQDISSTNKSAILTSMTNEQQYTLKDKRDGKAYTVSKLADGNIWMTQNLDLDLDSSRTYTNEDTDLGWNTSTNTYDTASWSPIRSTYETSANNIHAWCQGGTWNSQDGYCEQNNTPESYDPGDLYWNTTTSASSDWFAYLSSCDYSTSTPSCNESLNPLSTYTSSTGTAQYHLGNYYNWSAAIASNDASVYGYDDEDPDTPLINPETHQSICPAGWTLPYANYNNNTDQSEGDFANLWTEYGWDNNNYGFSDISTVWSAPLYFAPAGGFSGNLGIIGGNGNFWSSVAYDVSYAHSAYFDVGGGAYPADNDSRISGYLVRCILR